MALVLKKETQYGIDCEYWRVMRLIINPEQKIVEALVGLYVDKKARRDGKNPIITDNLSFTDYDNASNPFDFAYRSIKRLAEFKDSTDD